MGASIPPCARRLFVWFLRQSYPLICLALCFVSGLFVCARGGGWSLAGLILSTAPATKHLPGTDTTDRLVRVADPPPPDPTLTWCGEGTPVDEARPEGWKGMGRGFGHPWVFQKICLAAWYLAPGLPLRRCVVQHLLFFGREVVGDETESKGNPQPFMNVH